MAQKAYRYVQPRPEDVEKLLADAAKEGWTVHTFNPNSRFVDILLERPVPTRRYPL